MLKIVFSLFLISYAFGVERITEKTASRDKVMKIYLSPGRSSILEYPCHITKAVSGAGEDIELVVGSSQANEIDIWLKSSRSQPTNLIVRCQERVFVSDIIPSKINHQDYVKIHSADDAGVLLQSFGFGGPKK